MNILLKLLCGLLVVMLLSPTVVASGFDDYEDGDEEDVLGHSFDEEYWTSSVTNTTDNGNATFSVSYVNYADVQVFLVSLKEVKGIDGGVGVLPYQLLGMHYFTPKGREVFIGAVFAFLMAYNDTNGNNIQDPGNEPVYYIMPYGLGNENGSFTPETTVHSVQKLGEGHYRFGITYRNLFAKIFKHTDNPLEFWLFAAFPILHARFSEFTVMYEVTIDESTGEMKTETYYTIGQVEVIRFLGIPLPVSDVLNEAWGISAVHYVSVFASWYKITNSTGHDITSGIDAPAQNISIQVGDDTDRAFEIGYRGTYDLLDESTTPHTVIKSDKDAYNILLQAREGDKLLIAWQLGFSAGLFSLMSYALSDEIQERYESPKELRQKWWKSVANTAKLWYAVSFPSWQGYRVEHDPTYTAYFGDAASTVDDEESGGACGAGGFIFIGAVFIPGAAGISKRFKRRKKR